jgi:hypothetical protein
MKREWVSPLFLVAAAYDFVLGLGFMVAFKPVMTAFNIELPNHDAYVQLPAAMIAIFGIGFWFVSRAPERNRDIIKLGIMLKLAYSGIILAWYAKGMMPTLWVAFALADLAFMVAFVAALRAVPVPRPEG